jgi:hypothetical protein
MPTIVASAASAASTVTSPGAMSEWLVQGSLKFEALKALPTILIAIFVAYVAYQQLQVARSQRRLAQEKVRLDLFKDRLRAYRALADFLNVAEGAAPEELWRQVQLLQDATAEAFFLFGPQIGDLYRDAITHAIQLKELLKSLRAQEPESQRHVELSHEVLSEIAWFGKTRQAMRHVFRGYLDFSEWTHAELRR